MDNKEQITNLMNLLRLGLLPTLIFFFLLAQQQRDRENNKNRNEKLPIILQFSIWYKNCSYLFSRAVLLL